MLTSKRTSGVALITSLAILTVVGILVLGAIMTTRIELAVTRNDSTATQAQYVAQAGLQKYKAVLFQNFQWVESLNTTGSTNLDACTNSLESGIDFDRDGVLDADDTWTNNTIVIPTENVVAADGSTVIGTYDVVLLRDPNNHSRITVRSVAQTSAGTAERQARATASGTFYVTNSSVLEQAIFAGVGSDMRFLNGNTTVYGGVYIVGQPDENEDEPLVFEANGNFSILNGYDKSGDSGNFAYLVDGVRTSSNLCAALRVQRGQVAVGGSTQLGQPNNKLITVAVSDGAEDILLQRGGTENCLNNKGICTEVGPKAFDIEDPPEFPLLDEPAPSELCDTDTWRECIREEAIADGMTIVNSGSGYSIQVGNAAGVAVDATCATALTNASSTGFVLFDTATIDCRYTDGAGLTHGFYYNTATEPETLQVFGNLNVQGFDLDFRRATQYQARSRDDTGVVKDFAGLSIEANAHGGGSMYAANHFVADQALGKFPDNVLSIIAEVDVDFYGNQKYYTTPVYAQNQFRLRGNAQLFGQVIANQFCTTNGRGSCSTAGNPSEIAYVPTGGNRAKSFQAIAPMGGTPTFETMAYELR